MMCCYVDCMDLVFVFVNLIVLCFGVVIVSEISVFGIFVLYVFYFVGNGEQCLNVSLVVVVGVVELFDDVIFDGDVVCCIVVLFLGDDEWIVWMVVVVENVGICIGIENVIVFIDCVFVMV